MMMSWISTGLSPYLVLIALIEVHCLLEADLPVQLLGCGLSFLIAGCNVGLLADLVWRCAVKVSCTLSLAFSSSSILSFLGRWPIASLGAILNSARAVASTS